LGPCVVYYRIDTGTRNMKIGGWETWKTGEDVPFCDCE
jgi:hypothetical protein